MHLSLFCYLLNQSTMPMYLYAHADAINDYESKQMIPDCLNATSDYKTLCTGGIFATYPKPFLSLGTGFFDQVCALK